MNQESCIQCSTIGGCPFSFTFESEQIQNYGCLPEPMDIVNMRQVHGKTWACHSNQDKPCLGAMEWQKKNGMEYSVIDKQLVTLKDNWDLYARK